MKLNAAYIQRCYDTGNLHEGMSAALIFIANNSTEDSQLELFLLAKGLFAVRRYSESLYYLNLTKADPINNEELREKLNKKLNLN